MYHLSFIIVFTRLCGNEITAGFTNPYEKTEVNTRCSFMQCCVNVYNEELYLWIIQLIADKFVRVSVPRFRCCAMAVGETLLPFVCARRGQALLSLHGM